jgi:hypothetical protein
LEQAEAVAILSAVDAGAVHGDSVGQENDQGQESDEDGYAQRSEQAFEDKEAGRDQEGRGAEQAQVGQGLGSGLFDRDPGYQDRGHGKEAQDPHESCVKVTSIKRGDKKVDQRPDHQNDQDRSQGGQGIIE